MHPVPRAKEEMLAFGKPFTNNLIGLEKSIPPRASVSIRSSLSDVNKPLPSIPDWKGFEIRPSSLYSTDINEFIDLYLTGNSNSRRVSSEDARLSLSSYYQHMPLDTSKVYGDSKFSVSESVLTPIGQTSGYHRGEMDEFTIRYRYSNPEGRSPTFLESTTREHLHVDDIWTADLAKKYRDTLLPAPFTPISIKSPELFPNIVPLRGPRFIARTSSELTRHQSTLRGSSATNFVGGPGKGSLRLSTGGTCDADRQSYQNAEPKVIIDIPSSIQYSSVVSETSSQDRSSIFHGTFATSVNQKLQAPRDSQPVPYQYLTAQQDVIGNYPTRSTSFSDQGWRNSDASKYSTLLPRNWRPYLKPSNPEIPSVPLSERSPAVGLSAYQTLGPKAWELDKQKELDQSRHFPFRAKKKAFKRFTNKLRRLDLESCYMPQVQYHSSHSSMANPDIHRSVSGMSWTNTRQDDQNLGRFSQPIYTTDRTMDFSQSLLSHIWPNTTNLPQRRGKESNKNLSWFKLRKQKAANNNNNLRKTNTKDKIKVIPADNSGVVSRGNSPSKVANEARQLIPHIHEAAPKFHGSISFGHSSVVESGEIVGASWI